LTRLIEVNISNLAGVPSIIYGLLGLGIFVNLLGAITGGQSIVSGALTLSLLILPVIIIATREALRTIPGAVREGGYALGATRWEVIRSHLLPMALPGALTGTILALSRAIGETAPLIVVGAATYITFAPDSPLSAYSALPHPDLLLGLPAAARVPGRRRRRHSRPDGRVAADELGRHLVAEQVPETWVGVKEILYWRKVRVDGF
jgi:ABC-type phosphate transport system permease subunit